MPEAVASPCIDVCKMEDGLCAGCYRTMKEIVRWGNAGDDEKRQILIAVAQRRMQLDTDSAGKRQDR